MRERRTNDQTQATRMNRDAHKKSMKKLFARFECQKENHREEKKMKFRKTFEIFTDQSTIL
jgi:t-SNARE complex subunit (syntaxin)